VRRARAEAFEARKVWNVPDAPDPCGAVGAIEPFRADQDEMETEKKLSDPFDGRPCNELLQGMPGAELALMHRFKHAALPGSNGGSRQ